MVSLSSEFLRGSYSPLVTPFRNGAVDYGAYARLIERQITEGSHGIVVNGTTAEPSTLSVGERVSLLQTALACAAGRIPVVAATGSHSHVETVEMTVEAERAGASAVLIVTPYFIKPPQRGLVEYYVDICGRVSVPALIYHIPGRAAVSITTETVERIAERAQNLVGMKHATNDLALVTELLIRLGPEFRIFVGLEELSFPMLAVGACGLMNAVGNIVPRRVAALYEHVASGRLAQAREAHFNLFELNQSVFFDTNPIPLKYMMKRAGLLDDDEHRLPMMPASVELAQRLDDVMRRAGLL